MEKYLFVLRNSNKELLTYRFSLITEFMFSIIPITASSLLWISIYKMGSGNFHSYDLGDMLIYILVSRILATIILPSIHWDISEQIQSGDLSKYLILPISHMLFWFNKDLAKKIQSFAIGIFLLAVFIFLYSNYLTFSFKINWLGLFSIFFSSILYYLIYYFIASLAFKFVDVTSFFYTSEVIIEFLSGAIIPVVFFPNLLKSLNNLLPFQYLISFPINIWLGKIQYKEIIYGLSVQFTWIFFLYFLCKISWKIGLKRYEGTGS